MKFINIIKHAQTVQMPAALQPQPRFDVDELRLNEYAAALGVVQPVEVEWVPAAVMGANCACCKTQYNPDTGELQAGFVIEVADDFENPEDLAGTIRHELKHAEQTCEVGAIEFASSYQSELDDLYAEFGTQGEDIAIAYSTLNVWEAECNDAMVAEKHHILPMLTERSNP